MQIYEVTQRPVQEGLLGDIGRGLVSAAGGPDLPQSPGSAATSAAKSAAALNKQGYGPGGSALPSSAWGDKYQTVQKDPAVGQYISSIMQGWSKQMAQTQQQQRQASLAQPAPQAGTTVAQQTTPQATAQSAASSTVSKARPTYGKPDTTVSFAGQRQKPLDPNNPKDAQILAQLKKQGVLQEAVQMNAADYKNAFQAWTDQQLASRDSRYNAITMNDVRKHVPNIAAVLEKKLNDVVKTRGTPQSDEAIRAYLQVAIAGVQARSQSLKNEEPQSSLSAASQAQSQQGAVTQALTQAGVDLNPIKSVTNKFKSNQARSTGNAEVDAMLQRMGVQVR